MKNATDLFALSDEGDVVEGTQQPQADGHVRSSIVPELLERGVEETVEIDPLHDNSQNVRRAKEMRPRRSATNPSNKDPI